MLAHSIPQNTNQLKLNLDALVSNLNLVNIIHQPKPIIIENVNNKNKGFNDYNNRSTNSDFNLIDENKLKMFSFLAERKLKEKEWHAKYFTTENTKNLNNKPTTPKEVNKKPTNLKEKEILKNKNQLNKNINEKNIKINNDMLFNIVPLDVKINEMKDVCKHLMNTVDNLENILNEYHDKRLKFDCIDIQEENKQIKIHNEQIKNASRLMYNFQNQLRQLELELNKPDKVIDDFQKTKIIGRLLNTERYIIKSIENLNQTYPYRNEHSNKLYKNLFKHLTVSTEVFSRLVYVLNLDPDSIIKNLNQKMFNCNKIINENCENDENNLKIKETNLPKKPKSIEKPAKKVIVIKQQAKKFRDEKKIKLNPVTKEILDSSTLERNENSNREDRPILVKKTIQTARLFPSARTKSSSNTSRNSSREEIRKNYQNENNNNRQVKSMIEFKNNHQDYISPRISKKVEFQDNLNSNNNNNNNNSIDNSFNDYQNRHDESYNNKSKCMCSRENDIDLFELQTKYKNFKNHNTNKINYEQKQIEDSYDLNESLSPLKQYPIDITYNKSPNDYNFINNIYSKMNQIKEENDSIRRKYEMLKYSREGIINKKITPYAECYVHVEEPKLNENLMIYPVDDEYSQLKKSKINDDQNEFHIERKPMRQINTPKNNQIERIIEYRKKFSNYSKRNTYLSNSQIDEMKLFDHLSEDVFDECFTNVCYEIESLNNDLANNLFNVELLKN